MRRPSGSVATAARSRQSSAAAGVAAGRVAYSALLYVGACLAAGWVRPLGPLRDPLERVGDRFEPSLEFEARGGERRASVVGQRAAHRQAIVSRRLGLRLAVVGCAFQGALDGTPAAHALLELFLGVPVCLNDRAGRLAQVVELTELVGHAWQRPRHRVADVDLPVRNAGANWDGVFPSIAPQDRA